MKGAAAILVIEWARIRGRLSNTKSLVKHKPESPQALGMTSTPISEAAARTGAPRLRFVVQKHWARSLHYDFRLEIGTGLVSWAVPKGPSKDPKVKRLAIHVEDHPLDYLLFEGTLPPGDYGTGEVIVWDFGEFEVVEPAGYDPAAALRDGIIRFALYGTKLRGQWAIMRTKMGRGSRENWLWQKVPDEFAEAGYDPETEPASALSGKVPRGRR
jgi:bifunctional non-homologous end joining protein LigD